MSTWFDKVIRRELYIDAVSIKFSTPIYKSKTPKVLVWHIIKIIEKVFDNIKDNRRDVTEQIEFANKTIDTIIRNTNEPYERY